MNQGNDQHRDDTSGSANDPDAGTRKGTLVEAVKDVPDEAKQDVVAAAVRNASDEAKKDVATAAVKAAPDEVKQVVAAEAVKAASNEAQREIATAAVNALPDDETDAKTQIAKGAVNALPDDAAYAKTEIANEAVNALPDDETDAKTQIAKGAVDALPDDAADAKREIAQESARGLPPEYQDSLIAQYVSTRRLFGWVFVWTLFGAFVVALVVAVLAIAGADFSVRDQTVVRVATPTTTLLLGYVIAKFYSRKTDIKNLRQIESLREELKSLREQNTGSGEGDVSVKK